MLTVDAGLQPVSKRIFLDKSQRIKYHLRKLKYRHFDIFYNEITFLNKLGTKIIVFWNMTRYLLEEHTKLYDVTFQKTIISKVPAEEQKISLCTNEIL
jgi:hypothetical protein